MDRKILLESHLSELERITKGMDVPVFRRRNVSWLDKHLHLRNSQHKDYEKAIQLIKELLNNGVSHG